jgi:hypothetical protein
MSISRRKFLKAGTIVAISAGIPLNVLANGSAGAGSLIFPGLGSSAPRSAMDSEVFARFLNTQFTLRQGETQAKFTLVEVRHWNKRSSKKTADGKECFSLIFENAGSERLTQDTYTAAHSSLGEFPLFVVPSGKTQKKYEALFNRLHG